MGLIKEPKGVDFYVDPRPLTKEEELSISAFIKADKLKHMKSVKKRSNQKKKVSA